MDELRTILNTWSDGAAKGAVLATVVHVTGSAYRRPGARMLLLPNGERIGSISGGCLEGEIARKAWWFTESGSPALRVYDTTSDDDAVWEFGLGCNGVVHVLLEREATFAPVLNFLRARAGRACVVATVIRGERLGEHMLLDEYGSSTGSLGSEVEAFAGFVLHEKKSRLVHLADEDVFLEWVGRPQSLVIFGAGHDAVPVVRFAQELGWRVTVADGRPAYTCAERFPGASVVLTRGDDPLRGIEIDSDTAVVMMTHNYPLDARLVQPILTRAPRYLGMLGPKNRAERLFAELGIREVPNFVHAPVGLDIGCDTPQAIALSIVSEIQSVLSDRRGGFLRDRKDAIHAAPRESGAGVLVRETVRPLFCETGAGHV